MSKRDYYEVLGLERNATDNDIKRAYRKLARQYHPDVNNEPESEQIFKDISEAYTILSDPQRRASYDRFGHAGVGAGSGFGGAGGFDAGGFGFGGLGDIFEAFFGGSRGDPFQGQRAGGQRSRVERGSDLRLDLQISFREAIFGAEREIEVQHLEHCEVCDGKGMEPGTQMSSCSTCRGSGQIQQHQRTAFGTFTHITTCPKCQGAGNFAEHPCKNCKGKGRSNQHKTLKVNIPAGVDTGVRLCMNGYGDAGAQGGPAGDLYLVLHVQADSEDQFERRDNEIYTDVSVGYAQAALGDRIDVPTLEGPTKFEIPAGTQPGTVFKLRNKGVPYLNSPATRGDLYFKVKVAVPTEVNPEQRQLLENLYELEKGLGTGFSFTEGGGLDQPSGGEHADAKKKHGFFDILKETWKSHHKEE
ncbi:MAG: molecular chaperone DnaJ [Candidatus Melainabacteria bacterium HGW-Melainabacteria-1]|nr:MAG: molecular chaperone DnaJ [Candidatus Melainabacteria bacterium HGW-Melainabacteria-1]